MKKNGWTFALVGPLERSFEADHCQIELSAGSFLARRRVDMGALGLLTTRTTTKTRGRCFRFRCRPRRRRRVVGWKDPTNRQWSRWYCGCHVGWCVRAREWTRVLYKGVCMCLDRFSNFFFFFSSSPILFLFFSFPSEERTSSFSFIAMALLGPLKLPPLSTAMSSSPSSPWASGQLKMPATGTFSLSLLLCKRLSTRCTVRDPQHF